MECGFAARWWRVEENCGLMIVAKIACTSQKAIGSPTKGSRLPCFRVFPLERDDNVSRSPESRARELRFWPIMGS